MSVYSELPPSAAQEPPPTPKVTGQTGQFSTTSTVTTVTAATTSMRQHPAVSTILIPVSSAGHLTLVQAPAPPNAVFKLKAETIAKAPSSSGESDSGSPPPAPLTIVEGLDFSFCESDMVPQGLSTSRKELPPPLNINSISSATPSLLGMGELVPSLADSLPSADLPWTMDWSDTDTSINHLDLPDMLDTPSYGGLVCASDSGASQDLSLLGTPVSSNTGNSQAEQFSGAISNSGLAGAHSHSSDINLSTLGLHDDLTDPESAMNVDVSDWLEVIMPSTGLTPLSSNAPVSFTADPILTPKPQDVLDIFNMDETDLYTPTELAGVMNFDPTLDSSTSKT